MAALVCDYAHGRTRELYARVKNAEPAGSALLVVLLAAAGVDTNQVIATKPNLAAVLTGTTDEATNSGYSRKVLTAADLAAVPLPDTVNHWWQAAIANQAWGPVVLNDGTGPVGKLLICYRPAPGSPDADVIPVTVHDFPVIPIGVSIVTQIDANGYVRAAQV